MSISLTKTETRTQLTFHRSLLPKSCKIYASAGAGFDWVDTKTMGEHGTCDLLSSSDTLTLISLYSLTKKPPTVH